MTDQINEQISAFIDNELSAEESSLLVRRLERDPEARARAMRYTLIGAALRGELLEPHPAVLSDRISGALSGVVPSRGKRQDSWRGRAVRPLVGAGIAAAVALAAIGLLRFANQAAPPASQVAVNAPVATPIVDAAPSYVVPRETGGPPLGTSPIRLTNYLMHHGVYASSLARTTVNSNVVGTTSGLATTELAEPAEVQSGKPVASEPLRPE